MAKKKKEGTPETPQEKTPKLETPQEEPKVEAAPPETETAEEGTSGKKRRKWPWIVGIVAIIVFAFIPYYYTSTSESCGKCHSMDAYFTSWQKSMHGKNETPCSDCHVRPGTFANVTYRVAFYREIVAEMFGMNLSPWGATAPGEESCTRDNCHSLNRLSSRSGELKVDHAKHYNIKHIPCRQCHAGVTHPGVKGIGSELPPNKQCFQCHKKQVEAKNCSFCHSKKYDKNTPVKTPHI